VRKDFLSSREFRSSNAHASARLLCGQLLLRPYRVSDWEKIRSSQQGALTFEGDGGMSIEEQMTPDAFACLVSMWKRNWRRRVHYVFGVFGGQDETHLGRISLFLINRQLRWANIGFQIHHQYRGHGVATDAARMALAFAFETLGFHRIEAATDLKNVAAARVAIKVGMEFEGLRRNFFHWRVGSDMQVYAANYPEYLCRRDSN
jgi:ribosomal-protein-alanine N-acetyltransferase